MKVDKVIVRFIVFSTLCQGLEKTQKKQLRLGLDGYPITIKNIVLFLIRYANRYEMKGTKN